MSTAIPIWFGPEDRPLFGMFHSPEGGRCVGGVVVCPPFDRDYLHAHYALRLLAEQLAGLGYCTLRFDYDGTGDSAGGPEDPDRLQAWMASIRHTLAYVRAMGVPSVTVVGMRIGATLGGIAAERDGAVDSLVLWDPVVSGRAYLTEQRALAALSLGPSQGADDGGVDTPGMRFDAATVHDLRTLDLARTTGNLARRVLILSRSGEPGGRLGTRFAPPEVEWGEATGQADLMDTGSPNQVLPHEAIERVATWIASNASGSDAVALRPCTPAGSAVVSSTGIEPPVLETPCHLGPVGLFGIRTELQGATGFPTVVFLNVANEHRLGPARLWVELARELAGYGIPSVRVDLSGLGDSPTRRPDQKRFVTRAPEAFDDVIDVCRAIRPDDPSGVVLIGLCASAYQALDSAFDVHPKGVVAINPILSFRAPELSDGGSLSSRRHVAIPRPAATQTFHGSGALAGLGRRFPKLRAHVRDTFEVIESLLAPPRHRPSRWLGTLVGSGVSVLVICGEREARPIQVGGSGRRLREFTRSGRFELEVVPELEHGLLIAEQRADVGRRAIQHVVTIAGAQRIAPVLTDMHGARAPAPRSNAG